MNRLKGKVALVTGAANGIGKSSCLLMAREVGWACVYLASDEAKFVTGAQLVVDGGYTCR